MNQRDDHENTVAHYAARNKNPDVMKSIYEMDDYILEHINADYDRPCEIALEHNNLETAKFVMQKYVFHLCD